ncbi:MAG: DNA-directed RNA polymerase subunit omega [Treponemataceae bacterium]|nr:DNA-directed RNA polymerase subunit omega [Treponemataceae bacterium]
MIFPLEELISFEDNVYEITSAASHRAYQLSMIEDPIIEEYQDKVVSVAAHQLFTKEIGYSLEG